MLLYIEGSRVARTLTYLILIYWSKGNIDFQWPTHLCLQVTVIAQHKGKLFLSQPYKNGPFKIDQTKKFWSQKKILDTLKG